MTEGGMDRGRDGQREGWTEGEMNRGRDDGGMDRGREREGVLLIIRNVSFICFSLRCM